MYIKSIVIDGFKSYAQRTEVNGFDPMFNAITGLNGSGKSNILDSICFLLGISNLTQVRATSLQELVYKNGQAGVTKATVSITFDNSDKKQSPLGYEQYDELSITRQVVIGGRNKYLINGSNANNTRVQDLFRSVQLNVNNPHFLIMQGRITKVLNMKPPEILSMIEEAAGTRLYESKKESAQKTIAKKEMKLQEIDRILKEDINPTLTKLKDERSSYLEYQKIIRELEHLNKVYIAWQFVSAQEMQQKTADELVEMQKAIKDIQNRQHEYEEKVKELDRIIYELEQKRDKEAGGVLVELENKLAEQRKADSIATSALSEKKDTLKAEQKKAKDLTKHKTDDEGTLASKRSEMNKLRNELDKLLSKSEADAEALVAAQKHYQAVSAGLSSAEDGQTASLQDQLTTAEKELSQANSDIQEAQMRLKHGQQEVKKKQGELKKTEQGYKKHQANYDIAVKSKEKLQAELQKLSYEEGQEERMNEARQRLTREVQQLQEKVDTLEARFPQLRFDYKDPEKNFDRKKVHGLVASLIKVKNFDTATALEVAAGGKLYNVVVDTEVTGKKLLQKGELKRRYTIIPLNKISARKIPSDVVGRAERLVGKNNVHTALSLVGYEDQLQSAMEFVFGNAFVCKDMESAKKVTYDDKVMKKSVTLSGDSFDPAGTLTGGARPQSGAILAKLTELKDVQDELTMKQSQLQQLEAELAVIKKTAAKYRELHQQYDVKCQEVHDLEQRQEQSSHGQQLAEVNSLLKNIEEYEALLSKAKDTSVAASKRVKDLEYKVKNAKALREKELKEAENGVSKAKKAKEDSNKKMKQKEQEVESLKLESAELEKDISGAGEQLAAVAEAIKGYEAQVADLKEAAANSKRDVSEAETAVKQQKDLLKSCSHEIAQQQTRKKQLQESDRKDQLALQEMEHKVSKFHKDSAEAAKQVEYLLQQYDWIADEKKYFGQPNTAYDFKTTNPKDAQRRIQKLQETKDKLAKNVNMRAMNMLGKAEEQYDDLMKKRSIVLNDKVKIAAVIAELDKKKNEALKTAHQKVNKDFGSIFSTLLPGTQAKLVAPEGQSILDGLEVKVAFGDVWKESLTELSGGQRSLVALSLILSLLLFKPAPLYILDEVDAALDLSHTQNIGQMLRTHFKHSQFIVVSLKDGMFNNANVLFKTKFVDGVSTVSRYTQQQPQRGGASTSSVLASISTNSNNEKKKGGSKRPRIEEVRCQ